MCKQKHLRETKRFLRNVTAVTGLLDVLYQKIINTALKCCAAYFQPLSWGPLPHCWQWLYLESTSLIHWCYCKELLSKHTSMCKKTAIQCCMTSKWRKSASAEVVSDLFFFLEETVLLIDCCFHFPVTILLYKILEPNRRLSISNQLLLGMIIES